MTCRDYAKIKAYFDGKLNSEEEAAIDAHISNCNHCQEILDELINKEEKICCEPLPKNVLSEKQQQKILLRAKFKNRFNIAATLLFLFIALQIAGSFLSAVYFNWGKENSLLYKSQKTAVLITEFTFPNVTIPLTIRPMFYTNAGWGHSSLNIKPYFVANGSYALQKQVGRENYTIGHLNINYIFSIINRRWSWDQGMLDNNLFFFHPGQIDRATASAYEQAWDVLDIIPEGTVAELGLSFWEPYTIDEVIELFSDFDIEITWYAIATGLELSEEEDRLAPLTAFRGVWGFSGSEREEYFIESMKFLVENQKIANQIYRGAPSKLRLDERLEYLHENGVKAYGVVVTGPSKELLKLKGLEAVYSPALGEYRLWNWFYRSFRGQLYS